MCFADSNFVVQNIFSFIEWRLIATLRFPLSQNIISLFIPSAKIWLGELILLVHSIGH
jgi:hypothetical protein